MIDERHGQAPDSLLTHVILVGATCGSSTLKIFRGGK